MDVTIVLFAAVALGYVGAVIYMANQEEVQRRVSVVRPHPLSPPGGLDTSVGSQQRQMLLRWLLYGVAGMVFIYGLLILQLALLAGPMTDVPELDVALPTVDPTAAVVNFFLAVAVSLLSLRVVNSDGLRQRIKRLSGVDSAYDPDSSVHTVAIVLALAFLAVTIGQLVLTGGLQGLAEDVQGGGVSVNAVLFQTVLMIAAAFLGVGLSIRRTLAESLARLGLRPPTVQDVTWGIGVGLGLILALQIMIFVWTLFVPIEQITQQSAAADEIARAFSTLPLAFLISATAAISEEILFRGALQPVFGLGLTSVYFALVHMQYTLTPATLIIFVVGLGLGWLRQRQSTTAAILAHFVYNFTLLAVGILSGGSV